MKGGVVLMCVALFCVALLSAFPRADADAPGAGGRLSKRPISAALPAGRRAYKPLYFPFEYAR